MKHSVRSIYKRHYTYKELQQKKFTAMCDLDAVLRGPRMRRKKQIREIQFVLAAYQATSIAQLRRWIHSQVFRRAE